MPQPGKRLLDVIVSAAALIILSPIIALAALLVALWMGWPVLFRQIRPGLHGQSFTCLKLRTMTDARNGAGELRTDTERLTLLGRCLRKASIDEFPQLWNVLRGEMSLVGPRPLLMEYLPNYTPEQQRRHDVLPGITGWAQVNGRNAVTLGERLKLDVWYVEHWSLWLDLKILGLTLVAVVRSEGVKMEQALAEVDDIGLHPETRRKAAVTGETFP